VFVFELSARVRIESLLTELSDPMVVTLAVQSPGTQWLKHPEQLRELGILARNAFETALTHSSTETTWHILYAGPAPGAVKVGQQLNPTMTPPTQLYEYSHPAHTPSLKIESLDR
jgi:SMODS-associated and fused to various effectors sensor domain